MTSAPEREPLPPSITAEEAALLAREHKLITLGTRPPFFRYLRDLWSRRAFTWTFAMGDSASQHDESRLGQIWALLNPAFLIGSYYLIFGVLLQTRGTVENFVAFLAIGVTIFGTVSAIITRGSKAITGNLGLVRGLAFPRAVLPFAVSLSELIAAIPAFALLFVVVAATGERPEASWLLFPVSILFTILGMSGIGLMCARLVHASRDMGNLIPVAVRLLRYVSGIFFPVAHYAQNLPGVWQVVLTHQPFALTLDTAREALLGGPDHVLVPSHWVMHAFWGISLLVVGLIVFWRDEARYGRG